MSEQGNNPLHQDFINALPEELRESAPQYVEHWDKYVQEKFGEQAEYRNTWDKYQETGIQNLDPEEVQELVAFAELAAVDENGQRKNAKELAEWYNDFGELLRQQGLLNDQQTVNDFQLDYGQQQGVDPELDQRLGRIEQYFEQQETQARAQAADNFIRDEFDKIKQDNPNLNEEDLKNIATFASQYIDDDPNSPADPECIQKGYKDYQAVLGKAETSLFAKKSGQPARSVTGGLPNTNAERIMEFEDADEMARERVRQAMKQ